MDVISGTLFTEDNGDLSFRFGHSLISDYTEDDWVGTHTFAVTSKDQGKTWSSPELITLPRVKDITKESFSFGPFFRTKAGTVLYSGIHQVLDSEEGTCHHDMSLRDYMLLYARRENEQSEINIVEWPSGTYMGEQFLEGGFQLPSGRLVFTMWGIETRGENWRCGVLISDDDGKTWRFNVVGYEPDLSIRYNREQPAGFNEQTLFYTSPLGEGEHTIVSIIRGREVLGRGVPGGGDLDTWFFRSESSDDGETWTQPEPTNLPGTGATSGMGLTLPDGSLLIGCRIPYSREYYDLPENDLFGLNLARSFDNGRTWTPELIIQRDPEGNAFNTHHCAMNGFFKQISESEYEYYFGFFGHSYQPKFQRMLTLKIRIEQDS